MPEPAVQTCVCVQSGPHGECDECGQPGIVIHACIGGCDDCTCENRYVCQECHGIRCPVHPIEEWEWEDDE